MTIATANLPAAHAMAPLAADPGAHAAPHTAWQAARRILCVRLGAFSDVLVCTPAMRALRHAVPARHLTLLCSPSGAAVAPFVPEIDALIVHELPAMQDGSPAHAAAPALAETVAAGGFDAAVLFTSHAESALPAARLCQLAGIPLRLAHCPENPDHLLSNWIPEPEPASMMRHAVQRQLALVQHVACPAAGLHLSFVPRAADQATVAARLQNAGIDADAPWLLLHPGAGATARRYPATHWAQLIARLAETASLPIVLAGSAADLPLVDAIRQSCGVPTYSLAGQLALGELGAALERATVALTNNSGPAHIAAAVGTPLVALYALTHPQRTPWGVRSRVLFQDVPCRFCFKDTCPQGHHACLAGVTPARVVAAVLDLLEPVRPAAPEGPFAGHAAQAGGRA